MTSLYRLVCLQSEFVEQLIQKHGRQLHQQQQLQLGIPTIKYRNMVGNYTNNSSYSQESLQSNTETRQAITPTTAAIARNPYNKIKKHGRQLHQQQQLQLGIPTIKYIHILFQFKVQRNLIAMSITNNKIIYNLNKNIDI